jgi:hypothetical protein
LCFQIPDLPSLKRLKVLELKNWCDGCGIVKQGLKMDLINRLDAARSGGACSAQKYNLSSVSGQKMTVMLSSPGHDDQCPLTLDAVSKDSLDFLPTGVSFLKDCPAIKKMSLPCGHGFGALNIMYHFCKNNMQCPCCRAGPKDRAASTSVPKHLRTALGKHVKKLETMEQDEQDREDWRSLVQSAFGRWDAVDEDDEEDSDESDDGFYFTDDDDLNGDEDDEEEDDDDNDNDEDDGEDCVDDGSGSEDDDDRSDEGEDNVRQFLHQQMMIFATGRALGLL